MPTGIFTNAWVDSAAKILFRGASAPDSTKFKICLANTNTLGRTNAIAEFISAELLPTNGYARASASFSGDGSYDATDQRYENAIASTFTASGGALQFQTVFLLANATATASKSFTNADVNATTNIITITSHGFSNGDKLVFTADGVGTLPGGISANTLYAVASATTDTFSIGVDITDTGSGTFRARSANGIVVAYAVEPNPITIPDGQSYSYSFPLAVLNSGYVNGI